MLFQLGKISSVNDHFTSVHYTYEPDEGIFHSLEFRSAQGDRTLYQFPESKKYHSKSLDKLAIGKLAIKDHERFVGIIYNTRKGRPDVVYDVAFKIADCE